MIKIGHNKAKPDKTIRLFNSVIEGVEYIKTKEAEQKLDYLLVESNSVLNYINADLVIFLKNYAREEKESSKLARQKADLIIDKNFDIEQAKLVVKQKLPEINLIDELLNQYKYMFEN